MESEEPVYGTEAVSAATGASLRQLQWWVQKQILKVPCIHYKRLYRHRDALVARVLLCLRKHISLRQAQKALEQLVGEQDFMRAVNSSEHILLVGVATLDVRLTSRGLCYDVLLETGEPMVAVDLRAESMRLAEKLEAA